MSAHMISGEHFCVLHACLSLTMDAYGTSIAVSLAQQHNRTTDHYDDVMIRKLARCNAIAVCGRYPSNDVEAMLCSADCITLSTVSTQLQCVNAFGPAKKALLCEAYKIIKYLEYQCSETPRKCYEAEHTDSISLLTELKEVIADMIITEGA